MLIPEDGCLPKITSSSLAPFNSVMIIKVPEEFRKPGETIYQLATLDPSKKSEKWPADKYLDYLNSAKEKSFLKSNENEDDSNKINKSEVSAVGKKKSLFLPKKEKSKKFKESNLPDQRRINHDTRLNLDARVNQDTGITHDKRINQDNRINYDKKVHHGTRLYDDSRRHHNKRPVRDVSPWLPGVALQQGIVTSSLLLSYDQSLPNTFKPSMNCGKGLLGDGPGQEGVYSGPNVRAFDHIPASENIKSTRMPESVYSGSHRDDLNGPQKINFDRPSRNGPQKNNFQGPFRNGPSKKNFKRPFQNARSKNKFENSYQNSPPETTFAGIHRLDATENTLTGTNRNASKETEFGGRDGLISDAYSPDNSYNIGYHDVPRNIPFSFDSYANQYRDDFSSEPVYSSDRNYNQINRDYSSNSNFKRSYASNHRNNLPSNSYDANFNDVLGHNPTTNNCYENNYPQYGQDGVWDNQCEPNLSLNEPFRMPENVSQRNSFTDGNQSRSWRGNKLGNSYWNTHRNRVKRGRGNSRFQKRTS